MKKFAIRAISGIVYAAFIIFCIIKGGTWLLDMCVVLAGMGMYEFDKMNAPKEKSEADRLCRICRFALDIIGVGVLVQIPYLGMSAVAVWIALFLIRMILSLFTPGESQISQTSGVFGQLYLGIPFLLTMQTDIRMLPLIVFALLWLNDSGAYIVGSMIGRHKMTPRISPNKTWEGLFGGIVIAVLGMVALRIWAGGFFGIDHVSVWMCLLLAAVVCVFGTLGDLVESMFKRSAGVKDSGNCIPGHGGILDRIDSYLLAFPAAYLLLAIYSLF